MMGDASFLGLPMQLPPLHSVDLDTTAGIPPFTINLPPSPNLTYANNTNNSTIFTQQSQQDPPQLNSHGKPPVVPTEINITTPIDLNNLSNININLDNIPTDIQIPLPSPLTTPQNDGTDEEQPPKQDKTSKNKKKEGKTGKRGRKPTQDPPYTKLYKQPWLDGWVTCKRLALEYIEETKYFAQQAKTPLNEVRRLPSQSDLMKGTTKRSWTPMELILARAFLKEAELVNTSTKKGAVIKEESVNFEQLPELISKTVLPSTHAKYYQPKERKKKEENGEPKEKKKKAKKQKKEKKDSPASSNPPASNPPASNPPTSNPPQTTTPAPELPAPSFAALDIDPATAFGFWK